MAVSTAQLLGQHRSAILGGEGGSSEDFVDMNTFNNCRSFNPNHSPTRNSSEHSASVSPPSFDPPTLAEFGDEDEIEDESFEGVGKFHSRLNSHESKDDHHQKPMSAAQANKLKISTAERRATHNAIERARRESLNCRFLELARALPTMSNVKRPSKSAIVNKSLEFICESQIREYNLMRENNYLRAQVNELRAQLRMSPLPPASFGAPLHLQQQPLPPRPAPSTHHPISLPLGGSTLPPQGRPMGDGLARINMPLSADSGCFSIANTTQDTYAHPHDQAAGPFLAHHHQHHRSQSYPVNGFSLLGPTDVYGAHHHHHHQPSSSDGIGPTDPISFPPTEEINAIDSSPPNLTKAFYSSDEEGSGGSPPNVQNPFIPDSLEMFGTTAISPNPNQLTDSIMDLMQAQSNAHTLPDLVGSGNGNSWLKSEPTGLAPGLASTYLF